MNAQTIVITILGSEVFLYIIKELVSWLKERMKKPTALENGLMWLLRDRIESLMIKDIERGFVTKEMREFLNHGYAFYEALGGNGDMKKLKADWDDLELHLH